MKKVLSAALAAILLLGSLFSFSASAEDKRISVVTTIFPVYDWVREIAGEDAPVDIVMLLDTGVDLHSYQPSAQDIVKIATCDLFIYVGGESDEWTEDALRTVSPAPASLSLVEAMGEDIKEEEIVEGMEHEHEHDEEDHDHDHNEEEHGHDEEEHGHEHGGEADEHVWLSLRNARKLVGIIADAMAQIDPDNAAGYLDNARTYMEKLAALDSEYTEMIRDAAFDTVLFGDRFPFRYLTDDYSLDYYAAFSGCSAESEASFETVVFLAQKLDELDLPAVLTIENPKTRIAETVIAATKAKDQKILSLDSMQGTTAAEVREGKTYLSVMEKNLEILREALN